MVEIMKRRIENNQKFVEILSTLKDRFNVRPLKLNHENLEFYISNFSAFEKIMR
jgi:hypothetical protein